MSMDFINVDNEELGFHINNRGWRRVFCLALMYGWEPAGTIGEGISLNYFLNDGQLVTRDDALELGRAIERAIPDLKEEAPACAPEVVFGDFWEDEMCKRTVEALQEGRKDPAYIFCTTGWTKRLTELVEFCKAGEFLIY